MKIRFELNSHLSYFDPDSRCFFRAILRKGFPFDAAACFQLMELPEPAKVFAVSYDLNLFS